MSPINRPTLNERIPQLIAQGMSQAEAFHTARREVIEWAHANGYAVDKPATKRNK